MNRTYWVMGACLSLLLVGGLAMDVSAQPSAPSQAQIESRSSEKATIVDRDGSSKIFGIEPMAAIIIGAVLLVVIVIDLVAMTRRTYGVHYTHHRV